MNFSDILPHAPVKISDILPHAPVKISDIYKSRLTSQQLI